MARCEVQHKTSLWPYVKRCNAQISRMSVKILYRQGREDLYEKMDICTEHYLDYLQTLTLEEATMVEDQSWQL